MAIFTMSDLHLSLDTDKSMEVFGFSWTNYINRIYDNWHATVGSTDTVLIGGDISWAMHLKDCKKDFQFIDSLPGKKYLFKGNHDYWWESMSKLNSFVEENDFSTISFVNNNAFACEDALIMGSRGWILPGETGFGPDDEKIYKREVIRLELSMQCGDTLCEQDGFVPQKRICILHYPPFTRERVPDEGMLSLMQQYGITHCFYGHLHSASTKNAAEGTYGGIDFRLVSADHLEFCPIKV